MIDMTYTLDQFIEDNGLDRQRIEECRQQMLEDIRLQELKDARRASHLTQKELAEQMGVNQKRVSALESGDIRRTKLDTLIRYADGIGAHLHVSMTLPDGAQLNLV